MPVVHRAGGFQGASSLGNYGLKASVNTNIRIPGFPSILTTWLDNQWSEIINKLSDLPDIYILLPDVPKLFRDTNASIGSKTESKVKNEPVSDKW